MACSLHTFIFFLFISFIYMLPFAATNTLYPTQSIKDGQSLVSTNKMFKLVFSTLGQSTNRYVGIWSEQSYLKEVWIANRENPVSNTSGIITIQDNGNLAILDGSKNVLWSTNVSTTSNSTIAVLLDNGNLVLQEGNFSVNPGRILWQSFDHPSDVLLPGMKIGINLRTGVNRMLTSWKDENDPAPGKFTFGIDPDGLMQFFIWRGSVPYWRVIFWNGSAYDAITVQYNPPSSLLNFSIIRNEDEIYFTYSPFPTPPSSTASLLTMEPDGYLRLTQVDESSESTTKRRWSGRDECSSRGSCGENSTCNVYNTPIECKCLPGFEPNSGVWSDGCRPTTPLQCGNEDGLLSLKGVKVSPPVSNVSDVKDGEECRKWCLSQGCQCKGSGFFNGSCYVWQDEGLRDVFEEDGDGNKESLWDINVRVAASVLKLNGRQCNYCGTNIIPYPLSTNPDCGDPAYGNLFCNSSSGQLRFRALNGSYAISSINPKTRTLVIKPEGADLCWPRSTKRSDIQLNSSQPFHISNRTSIFLLNCSAPEQPTLNCSSSSACQKYIQEGRAPCFDLANCCSYVAGSHPLTSHTVGVLSTGCNTYASIVDVDQSLPTYDWWEGVEVKWDAPPEPICNVSKDCDAWPNSKCLPETTMDERKRCICNVNFKWDPLTLNCTPVGRDKEPSVGSSNTKRRSTIIISITVIVGGLLAGTFVYCVLRKMIYQRGYKKANKSFDVTMFGEDERKDLNIPSFSFESVLVSTENFSDLNKLGRGGFGHVYKGKLQGGNEIAVKRLSQNSGQGQREFKNEVILIGKLQHKNLVRLLGYCIEGHERILLYEYMPNKSLDYHLFDPNRCKLLTWEMRYNIILGITRGLLYLHEDSRLKIIHRDLKTSNILLDEEMNPKISDFGMARIFSGKQIQENTNNVVGTYGYISPEYASHGIFSVKSDVFSFGVILLEIITGMKNTLFYHSDQSLSLIGHAWQLWMEGKWMDLIDENINEACVTSEVQKSIHIALLCVQENKVDRPTMTSVVAMFNETSTLQTPKQPAFMITSSPNPIPVSCSRNEITISTLEGR